MNSKFCLNIKQIFVIEINNIQILYDNKECIKSGCFIAYPYEIVGISGESGTGKSSLLHLIGMISSQKCQYKYNHHILNLNENERNEFRNKHISFVTPDSELIDTLSVEKNLEFYCSLGNDFYSVDELLNMIHLQDKRETMPKRLSGGERQRVAIACALAKNTEIILGDELTSALDEENKVLIMDIFKKCANQGKIVVLVSHEKNILEQCDCIYTIEHCQLNIQRDRKQTHVNVEPQENDERNNNNLLKTFHILFCSHKKMGLYKLVISFIILIMIFTGATVFVQNKRVQDAMKSSYSTENLLETKLLILSDVAEEYKSEMLSETLVYPTGNEMSIEDEIADKIKQINHIERLYNYYIFDDRGVTSEGRHSNMNLIVERDHAIIEKNEISDEESDQGYTYSVEVAPLFDEEKSINENEIYVSQRMAHVYNIQEGDLLRLNLTVPFARAKSLNPEESYVTGKSKYFETNIVVSIPVELTVSKIIESQQNNN